MGFQPDQLLQILQQTPAYSSIMDTKGEKMIHQDFTTQAKLSQHHKDVRLIIEEAQRLNTKIPLSILHDALLTKAEELGLGDQDNAAIIEVFKS